MHSLPHALAPLAQRAQFMLYKLVPGTPKARKVPVDIAGQPADPTNPANHMAAHVALQWLPTLGPGHGLAFVFTAEDPFWFLDLDNCVNEHGIPTPEAAQWLHKLQGCAVETSSSGKGLHIFGCGEVPAHSCRRDDLGLEFYTEGRFVALTGLSTSGSADCVPPGLAELVAEYFPPSEYESAEWTEGPVEGYNGPADDDELVTRMLEAKGSAAQVMGAACSFRGLWECDVDELAQHFPDSERTYDASAADASLAARLAFWTGKDCARIERLMRRSGLARDKYERADYLPRTITRAVGACSATYRTDDLSNPPAPPLLGTPIEGPQVVSGYQYLSATQQLDYFKGCAYVQDLHRVFTPGGALLKSEQFNATYGGYVFQLDETGDKTTRKAFEAFTESQVVRWPKANGVCFRPEEPSGAMLQEEGRVYVNTYVPIETPRTPGDIGPFLHHLRKLLPVERDREILLAYMAACVQHKGVKFQWAPLLQGAEGNGKTLFTRCLVAAIGKRYSHEPKAADIDNKFNGWIANKLLIGVEDIYVPEHKADVWESLKPMITNDRLEIQNKGADQYTGDNRANFIINSNHMDAVRKTRNDRRLAMFYTAQQTVEDCDAAGMGGDYFPNLYKWLREGGYAYVAEFLHTYEIPDELNPAGAAHRAPETSSTEQAIAAGMGSVEQEVLEAIDEGRPGFAGGWISSKALDSLLEQLRAVRAIPRNKRRQLLQSLGYDWHPALNEGRVNNPTYEGSKPRLFIKHGHLSAQLQHPAEVVKAYDTAQTRVAEKFSIDKAVNGA